MVSTVAPRFSKLGQSIAKRLHDHRVLLQHKRSTKELLSFRNDFDSILGAVSLLHAIRPAQWPENFRSILADVNDVLVKRPEDKSPRDPMAASNDSLLSDYMAASNETLLSQHRRQKLKFDLMTTRLRANCPLDQVADYFPDALRDIMAESQLARVLPALEETAPREQHFEPPTMQSAVEQCEKVISYKFKDRRHIANALDYSDDSADDYYSHRHGSDLALYGDAIIKSRLVYAWLQCRVSRCQSSGSTRYS
jgi:hypothetical protein